MGGEGGARGERANWSCLSAREKEGRRGREREREREGGRERAAGAGAGERERERESTQAIICVRSHSLVERRSKGSACTDYFLYALIAVTLSKWKVKQPLKVT